LCSAGKHFSAGANFGRQSNGIPVHTHVAELFEGRVPIVAAVQGAAIGAGLGLACAADFRVGCTAARFAANFARMGLHHGFGLSVTLPAIVGQQAALDLLYTGRRVRGDEAFRLGLCDRFVADTDVRSAAHELAGQIASSAPLAVRSVRATMRGTLAAAVRSAMADEIAQQAVQRRTADFAEGVLAYRERRLPVFDGR
jgi:enoyl-CoA hydratase/carnithine racemase